MHIHTKCRELHFDLSRYYFLPRKTVFTEIEHVTIHITPLIGFSANNTVMQEMSQMPLDTKKGI